MDNFSLQYTNIVFDAKPDAVPFNYRISYKVTQLCLIMRICGRGDVCSLIKLHMISFALISQINMVRLIEFTEGTGSVPIVRFDPSVNRALTYAIAYGLIERQQNAKYKLTDHGQRLADQIMVVGDLMVVEIRNLNLLAKKLTETKVNEIVDKWRVKDAEN
ncbi:hypothetical protein RBG61_11850 [Paludicola sp. MB14-C6]|uniref:hypothetical protein n=1 Tax=Paludihabitans sp. MB14-C6 TaxID=3070656 RepID=UPI0027DCF389|nr:hypothetical protein [Paludicola sp. MB14-C6]WMJ22676.1 hypothetical protein RBG61_11850 [Paludicola sp. MB14-C6]